ncbi:Hint domain-containing protein [Jannaschia ovalis]|uniref:Hint domain-containing protein n=1 Tax=Jannaschia ovalis TaxID=3038773 RepID=A0ABY8LBT7_9RHOB|nr:Hint domain-containing protein [Jannaschia sp. GRR-S6-38]WGH77745.1 Hint domain-containing protein [Jannaschia sp. GRR-S6-38]
MTAYQRLPSAPYSPVPDGAHARADADVPTISFELAWLDHRGVAQWDRRRLPDTPELAGAVASLARGAILRGANGPIAIEDLMPGDRVATRGGGTAQIDWIGTRSFGPQGERPLFYRVAAHALGAAGPETDVLLGAQAHVLIANKTCHELVGSPMAFAPIAAFEDGHSIAPVVPPGEVSVYGIACAGQEAVLVSGMPVESYHPARATGRALNRAVLASMAQLFPQIGQGAGFGPPRIPYLSLAEAQGLSLRRL